MNTADRWSAKRSAFCFPLLAHGPGGVEHLRIGAIDVCGCSLFLIGFQIELSSLLKVETYAVKDAFRMSGSADLKLLLAWLHNRQLSGVWIRCQAALAFRFAATSLLIPLGV